MKIVIRGEFPSLNEIIAMSKKHWSVYSKSKKLHTRRVSAYCKQQGVAVIKSPVVIHFHWVSKDLKVDPDNMVVGRKYILDGFVDAGVLPQDSRRWIMGFSDSWDVDKEKPRVEVMISEV